MNAADTGVGRPLIDGNGPRHICAWRAISVAVKRQMMEEG